MNLQKDQSDPSSTMVFSESQSIETPEPQSFEVPEPESVETPELKPTETPRPESTTKPKPTAGPTPYPTAEPTPYPTAAPTPIPTPEPAPTVAPPAAFTVSVSHYVNPIQVSPSGIDIFVTAQTSYPASSVTISASTDSQSYGPYNMYPGTDGWWFNANFYEKGTFTVLITAYTSDGQAATDSFEYAYE